MGLSWTKVSSFSGLTFIMLQSLQFVTCKSVKQGPDMITLPFNCERLFSALAPVAVILISCDASRPSVHNMMNVCRYVAYSVSNEL